MESTITQNPTHLMFYEVQGIYSKINIFPNLSVCGAHPSKCIGLFLDDLAGSFSGVSLLADKN
jgi:hypothetical protein